MLTTQIVYVEIHQLPGSNLVDDLFWRGTWFVDEMCRNSVRGSSAVRETINRRIWRNQIY